MSTELFPLASVDVRDRIRGADDELDSLADSIRRYGILQPLLLNQHNVLVDGWRRYTAAKLAGLTEVPVHRREQMSEAEYFELELESNVRRRQFTWRENIKAVCKVHLVRKRDAVLTTGSAASWTLAMTGELLGGYSPAYVHNCLKLEPHIDAATFADCSGITDAVRLYEKGLEDAAVAEMAKRTLQNFKPTFQIEHTTTPCIACAGTGKASSGNVCAPCQGTGFARTLTPDDAAVDLSNLMATASSDEIVVPLSTCVLHGDSVRDLLPRWPAGFVDHIVCDPPFAIDVEMMQQSTHAIEGIDRIKDTHQVAENLELHALMFPLFYRLLKDCGFLVVWLDIMQWQRSYDLATAAGFRVQRWPHVWCKTSQCKNQMAHQNETKATEFVMLCRKGNATLTRPVSKNFTFAAGFDDKLSNPFAKPFEVWEPLISAVSLEGQTILDPFAGEGTCPLAALKLGRAIVAVEKDVVHFNYMLESVKNHWKSVHPNVKFI